MDRRVQGRFLFSVYLQRQSMFRFHRAHGYSLIELVVVIVLIAIVSLVAISRIMSRNAFDELIIRDQIISSIRLAQQKAIGRSDIVLTLDLDSEVLSLLVEAGNSGSEQEVYRSEVSVDDLQIRSDVNELSACDAVPGQYILSDDESIALEFDSLGNLLRGGVEASPGYPEDVQLGIRICLNGDPEMSICVSDSGYAYTGTCND